MKRKVNAMNVDQDQHQTATQLKNKLNFKANLNTSII